MVDDLSGLPTSIGPQFMPDDLPQLAEHWVMLINLSKMPGQVLSLAYRPPGRCPSNLDVDALKEELKGCRIPEQPETKCRRMAMFSLYNMQRHYQLRSTPRTLLCLQDNINVLIGLF